MQMNFEACRRNLASNFNYLVDAVQCCDIQKSNGDILRATFDHHEYRMLLQAVRDVQFHLAGILSAGPGMIDSPPDLELKHITIDCEGDSEA